MKIQRTLALFLNVVAILGPTAWLYAIYGVDNIQPRNSAYLLPVLGATVASFVVGVLSARALYSSSEGFTAIFNSLMKAQSKEDGKPHQHAKRAA